MYDLVIIGGGPAGCAAAVYAARKQIKTVLVAETFGGQSTESLDIQNWIGTEHIPGAELGKSLERHVRSYADGWVDIKTGVRATLVEKSAAGFLVTIGNERIETKTVLVATGGARRKLTIPGAPEFENKGVVYCASCDGPLFAGTHTVVVGAGNAGFETAAQLLAYAASVTLLVRGTDISKADPKTVDAVKKDPNMTILFNTEPAEIHGGAFVESLLVRNTHTGETRSLPASGIFVEIGMLPATALVKEIVTLDAVGRVVVDPRNQRTSTDGIWAAGDCTNGLYHQNNIAAGDAVKALEDIYLYVKARATA